jgi:hypothetical protein
VGQQIDLEAQGHWLPIVGVVADVKNSGLEAPADPEYYRLRLYNTPALGRDAAVLLKTALDPAIAARWIRRQIAAVDPGIPVKVTTMPQRLRDLNVRQRFVAALVALFAGFGLLLAAIGLYGLLSFLVAQRTREIGLRMALGATPGRIAGMMERQAAAWTLSGAAVGLLASVALGRLARGALFQVSPYDPWSLGAAIGVVALVAVAAAWWPAHRASTVDPAVSLRQQ